MRQGLQQVTTCREELEALQFSKVPGDVSQEVAVQSQLQQARELADVVWECLHTRGETA